MLFYWFWLKLELESNKTKLNQIKPEGRSLPWKQRKVFYTKTCAQQSNRQFRKKQAHLVECFGIISLTGPKSLWQILRRKNKSHAAVLSPSHLKMRRAFLCARLGNNWRKDATRLTVGSASRRQGHPSWGGIRMPAENADGQTHEPTSRNSYIYKL